MDSLLLYSYSDDGKSTNLLRFYSNGLVIGAALKRHISDFESVSEWFNSHTRRPSIQKGRYSVSGIEITFYLGSQITLIDFSGVVSKEKDVYLKDNFSRSPFLKNTLFKPAFWTAGFDWYKGALQPKHEFVKSGVRLNFTIGDDPLDVLQEQLIKERSVRDSQNSLLEAVKQQPKPIPYYPKESATITTPSKQSKPTNPATGKFLGYMFLGLIAMILFTCGTRKRVGCHCWDGTESYATGSGACSWHHGVMYWKHSYWWE